MLQHWKKAVTHWIHVNFSLLVIVIKNKTKQNTQDNIKQQQQQTTTLSLILQTEKNAFVARRLKKNINKTRKLYSIVVARFTSSLS